MPKVLRTSDAAADLLDIGRFIATESSSLEIALAFLDRVEEKCVLYATQPLMGTARPDLGENVHAFPVDSYVVIYQPVEDGIRMLMVIHGSRNIPDVFRDRMAGPNG